MGYIRKPIKRYNQTKPRKCLSCVEPKPRPVPIAQTDSQALRRELEKGRKRGGKWEGEGGGAGGHRIGHGRKWRGKCWLNGKR